KRRQQRRQFLRLHHHEPMYDRREAGIAPQCPPPEALLPLSAALPEEALPEAACQALSSACSRSGVRPAPSFALSASGRCKCQAGVALAVGWTGLKVRPACRALGTLASAKAPYSPDSGIQTGMSDHG